jgi:hypothetical protein
MNELRYRICLLLAVISVAGGVELLATTRPAIRQVPMLSTLDLPAHVLPTDCRLVPSPSRVLDSRSTASGLWGTSGVPQNPWSGFDRTLITRIYALIFGPPISPDGPPLGTAQLNEFALRSTEHVDAGYAAFYARDSALTAIHVYGVRFRDRVEMLALLRTVKPRGVFVLGDTVVRVYRDELGCSDAVIDYFSALSSK